MRCLPLLCRVALLASVLVLSACSQKPGPDHEAVKLPDLAPLSGNGPMLIFGPGNMPLKPPVIRHIKYHYYDCEGLVSDWFMKLLVTEMNYLAQYADLPPITGQGCGVGIGVDDGRSEPRYSVHLFNTMKQANDCLGNSRCETVRNVALVPHSGTVKRSYFLSDYTGMKKFHLHCLAPPQRWFKDISCEGIRWE